MQYKSTHWFIHMACTCGAVDRQMDVVERSDGASWPITCVYSIMEHLPSFRCGACRSGNVSMCSGAIRVVRGARGVTWRLTLNSLFFLRRSCRSASRRAIYDGGLG